MHPDDLDRIVDGERADRRDRRALPRAVPRDPSRRARGVDPRRGDPRRRRGRQPAVLARPDARRHRHRSHGARAAGSTGEVRRARGADPRDRLRGRRRRAHDHDATSARRSRRLLGITPEEYIDDPELWVDAPASGGPGRDARRIPRGARRGRTVHAGVPPDRHATVASCGSATAPSWSTTRPAKPLYRAGRDARHHPAQGGRGADRLPRVPRQADRPPEPRPCSTSSWSCRSRRARRHGLGVSVISSTSTTSSW